VDEKLFGIDSPGCLVRIPEGGKAFIPNPLPANFAFPADLWPLLAATKEQMIAGGWKLGDPANYDR
jgi:hypothetical protein